MYSNRKEGSNQTTLVQVTNLDYNGLQEWADKEISDSPPIPGDSITVDARLLYLTDAGSGDGFSITPLSYTLGDQNGLFKEKMSSVLHDKKFYLTKIVD